MTLLLSIQILHAEVKIIALLAKNILMFTEIFPDSNIAKQYHSARMKTTCILNGMLTPSIKTTLLNNYSLKYSACQLMVLMTLILIK